MALRVRPHRGRQCDTKAPTYPNSPAVRAHPNAWARPALVATLRPSLRILARQLTSKAITSSAIPGESEWDEDSIVEVDIDQFATLPRNTRKRAIIVDKSNKRPPKKKSVSKKATADAPQPSKASKPAATQPIVEEDTETAEESPSDSGGSGKEPTQSPEGSEGPAGETDESGPSSLAGRTKITNLTPAMRHYLELKAKHPDFLLLYQIGDFYEMFLDDAVRGSEVLDIALTSRGNKEGQEIPMAGIPVHALDSYLERMLKKGVMVAVCDQIESAAEAKKRKGLVRRDVTLLGRITPGTLTEDKFLSARRSNYLVCLAVVPANDQKDSQSGSNTSSIAMAWTDLSTGELQMALTTPEDLITDLDRLQPSEVLVPYEVSQSEALSAALRPFCLTPQGIHAFDLELGKTRLSHVFSQDICRRIETEFSLAERKAMFGILHYVTLTQRGLLPQFSPPERFASERTMFIGAPTRRALELTSTQTGDFKGSLLHVIDNTITSAGGRLLNSRLNTPLLIIPEIEKRLNLVEFFLKAPHLRDRVRHGLHLCFDIERSLQRLSLGRGSPRDLIAIAQTLDQAEQLKRTLADHFAHSPSTILEGSAKEYMEMITNSQPLVELLTRAIVPEPPTDLSHGGFIAPGYNERLDKLRTARDNSKQLVADLQDTYRSQTGVTSLKIKHRATWGYFVEVFSKDSKRLPVDFKHFQTKVNSMCFKTEQIRDLEQEINTAAYSAQSIEEKLFQELVASVLAQAKVIKSCSYALAVLDLSASNALFATQHNLIRPTLDKSTTFEIDHGRHLVVESLQPQASFVANDCRLTAKQFVWLITGANMGGKSTFLRQNAIICILAQTGLFVPAQRATIGVVDSVFTRVGAYDDLAKNRSTFLVEMQETAVIMKKATSRSLVIMDEIGRGTSTQDGLSIAWSVLEHLCNKIKCRTLFATHYHELVEVADKMARVGKFFTAVENRNGKTLFLHKIVPGQAAKSYGIEVALLAGMPASVIDRALQLFKTLETSAQASK